MGFPTRGGERVVFGKSGKAPKWAKALQQIAIEHMTLRETARVFDALADIFEPEAKKEPRPAPVNGRRKKRSEKE